MVNFIAGVFIGMVIDVVTMCFCQAAKERDDL